MSKSYSLLVLCNIGICWGKNSPSSVKEILKDTSFAPIPTDSIVFIFEGVKITYAVLPDILFSFDSYKLKTDEQKFKNKIIDFIKVNNPKKITIIGYTDSDGTDAHNLQLSLNRAKTIQQLIKNEITNCTILIDGKGKEMPVAINNTKENKQKNRRVEITFE